MRVEAREEREISIGIFLLESLPEDDDGMTRKIRGRLSWKEFEAHSSMWNSILYFLDRYPFAIGGGGDANI